MILTNDISVFFLKVCSSKKNLQFHILSRHTPDDKKPWRCTRCPKGFISKLKLEEHVNGVHLGLKPNTCEMCGATFSHNANKLTHIKTVHMGGPKRQKRVIK